MLGGRMAEDAPSSDELACRTSSSDPAPLHRFDVPHPYTKPPPPVYAFNSHLDIPASVACLPFSDQHEAATEHRRRTKTVDGPPAPPVPMVHPQVFAGEREPPWRLRRELKELRGLLACMMAEWKEVHRDTLAAISTMRTHARRSQAELLRSKSPRKAEKKKTSSSKPEKPAWRGGGATTDPNAKIKGTCAMVMRRKYDQRVKQKQPTATTFRLALFEDLLERHWALLFLRALKLQVDIAKERNRALEPFATMIPLSWGFATLREEATLAQVTRQWTSRRNFYLKLRCYHFWVHRMRTLRQQRTDTTVARLFWVITLGQKVLHAWKTLVKRSQAERLALMAWQANMCGKHLARWANAWRCRAEVKRRILGAVSWGQCRLLAAPCLERYPILHKRMLSRSAQLLSELPQPHRHTRIQHRVMTSLGVARLEQALERVALPQQDGDHTDLTSCCLHPDEMDANESRSLLHFWNTSKAVTEGGGDLETVVLLGAIEKEVAEGRRTTPVTLDDPTSPLALYHWQSTDSLHLRMNSFSSIASPSPVEHPMLDAKSTIQRLVAAMHPVSLPSAQEGLLSPGAVAPLASLPLEVAALRVFELTSLKRRFSKWRLAFFDRLLKRFTSEYHQERLLRRCFAALAAPIPYLAHLRRIALCGVFRGWVGLVKHRIQSRAEWEMMAERGAAMMCHRRLLQTAWDLWKYRRSQYEKLRLFVRARCLRRWSRFVATRQLLRRVFARAVARWEEEAARHVETPREPTPPYVKRQLVKRRIFCTWANYAHHRAQRTRHCTDKSMKAVAETWHRNKVLERAWRRWGEQLQMKIWSAISDLRLYCFGLQRRFFRRWRTNVRCWCHDFPLALRWMKFPFLRWRRRMLVRRYHGNLLRWGFEAWHRWLRKQKEHARWHLSRTGYLIPPHEARSGAAPAGPSRRDASASRVSPPMIVVTKPQVTGDTEMEMEVSGEVSPRSISPPPEDRLGELRDHLLAVATKVNRTLREQSSHHREEGQQPTSSTSHAARPPFLPKSRPSTLNNEESRPLFPLEPSRTDQTAQVWERVKGVAKRRRHVP
eukprot:Sspe_Gene.84446::Locus_55443_Transcript_1_1_Confidence_1.000_Length_3287::g.84446::m.84446